MYNLKKAYIRRLFTNPEKLLHGGIYLSGHSGQGEYLRWHPNGQLEIRCHYQDGLAHGRYKEWLEDGTLAMELIFRNGKSVRIVR